MPSPAWAKTVVMAKMPWATTTGSGKFRSGGTLVLLVSDGPGA